MFDLDQSISEWRRQMAVDGIKSAKALDELEGHLRDDVQQQMQSGSRAQHAFEIAVQRMGQPCALKSEFKKLGGVSEGKLLTRGIGIGATLFMVSLAVVYFVVLPLTMR